MRIRIEGASEHNLQQVNVEIGDGLTVVTGVSGSGKTSLVFDTLYHEAQRRFLEVFALGSSRLRLSPAKVQRITGLGPAVAVGQNLLNRNPGSTLATASGLHPFFRLLYAHYGERRCAHCGAALQVLSDDEIIERLVVRSQHGAMDLYAPLVQRAVGSHTTLLSLLAEQFGADAICVDGKPWQQVVLTAAEPHTIELLVGQASQPLATAEAREVLTRSQALGAQSLCVIGSDMPGGERTTLSRALVCSDCGTWFHDVRPVHFHTPCPHCSGQGCARCQNTGLHPLAASVRWQSLRLPELLALSVDAASALVAQADLPEGAARARFEITRRLEALLSVGLGYVTLDRTAPTLSRGEAQRVRLAVTLTSRLEDMLHVLDEPTIGQHPADVARLMPALRQLKGPVVYVEHDRIAAAEADQAIDVGPGAGAEGGRVVFAGTPSALWQADTATGRYFSLRERVRAPAPRPAPERFLTVRGANLRNLRNFDVPFLLGRLTVVTGVSGSGKSTLVEDVLVASLTQGKPVGCVGLAGPKLKAVMVDQEPIGRNPRSNPATYTKVSDILRDLFAEVTKLSPSHFTFNRPEGACPTCEGLGAVEVAMRYLPSTWIPCADCAGQRFSEEVLAAKVRFGERDYSIADVLDLTVEQAFPLLRDASYLPPAKRSAAQRILEALRDVGLGYVTLGQPSPTLSGGEAQRVKLAKYLGRRSLADQLLVLDEPSTGLHPQDVVGLLVVLDRLVREGATVIVVEHNTDIIRAADWIIDLGPGCGPEGGDLLYAGSPDGLLDEKRSLTARALAQEHTLCPRASHEGPPNVPEASICIRGARAHNLRNVDVDLPKGKLTVVTGVSGSGKSSLVDDILEAEAHRRYLESLSMYERQSTHEGPEAPVESISGLGVAISVDAHGLDRFDRRATVGTATELTQHLAVLLSSAGERYCLRCGAAMQRGQEWRCPSCGERAPIAQPRHFTPTNYAAACRTCHGVGSLRQPNPDKLIIKPERALCDGAMYSPGFFPKGYICKPGNGGYDMVQALALKYGFDPATTPWNEMASEAQQAFLFGDPEPLQVHYRSHSGREHTATHHYPGFYGWVRDWDQHGTYTDTLICPECGGGRLRAKYASVTVAGHNLQALATMPLSALLRILDQVNLPGGHLGEASLATARQRLRFLQQVGLGYVHLDRDSATLSAGEAQRVRLAGLLGSGLTSLTVLMDEPTRGLHPTEVEALLRALRSLRDEGNTVIVVEHDPVIIRAADHIVDMGPGPGVAGGYVVAQGTPDTIAVADTITGAWLRGERRPALRLPRCQPTGWLTIRGARENNLRGETIHLPLGALVGICGVSGSGKSTLIVDTLGRALAPRKQTSSVAYEPIEPGAHDAIEGAPDRAVVLDQTRAGVRSPLYFLNLEKPLLDLFAESEEARALGLDAQALGQRCSACGGSGTTTLDMGFLPDVHTPCDTCEGTGYAPEAWQVHLQGLTMPEISGLTLEEVHARFGYDERLRRPLEMALAVGLGYLVLRQPGYALSGGEAQRLKIAQELCQASLKPTLYILDEPTVGQHMEDVARLCGVLHRLVQAGHTVYVVEHHAHLLAACDWLIELGPGGGPEGGYVIASGPPESLAEGQTPTAAYLREVLS